MRPSTPGLLISDPLADGVRVMRDVDAVVDAGIVLSRLEAMSR